jgi:hypothetical protein
MFRKRSQPKEHFLLNMAEIQERFRFRDDAEVAIDEAGLVEVMVNFFSYKFTYKFDSLSSGVVEAIRLVAGGSASEDDLAGAVAAVDGDLGILGWKKIQIRFIQMGLINRSIWVGEKQIVDMIPDMFPMVSDSIDVHPSSVVSLSRFALLHLVDGSLELQTPRFGSWTQTWQRLSPRSLKRKNLPISSTPPSVGPVSTLNISSCLRQCLVARDSWLLMPMLNRPHRSR